MTLLSLALFLCFLGLNSCRSVAADTFSHLEICAVGNYTTNSPFHSNLNLLLTSLSSTNSTFFNDTKGSHYRAYGLVLCRGDITPSECRACIRDAARDVLSLCPLSKQATVWYNTCQLRYSDFNFFAVVDTSNKIGSNPQNVTDPDTFVQWEKFLMQTLSFRAAYEYDSSPLFATGRLMISRDLSIYGLAQCTGDLSEVQCSDCLRKIFTKYLIDTDGRQGGRVLANSCNLRYEVYPYYQGKPGFSINLPPPQQRNFSPAPPPKSPPRSRGSKTISGNVFKIAVPAAAAMVLILILLCICFFWRRRSSKKIPRMAELEKVLALDSLLFDLSIVKFATANFSKVNKLGEGGFGSVYKGILAGGQEIAVKRLSKNSRQGIEELKNELVLVAKLQHKNLVRLQGVCLDEEEKLLIYEYVPNRSLDTFLFDTVKCKEVNWETRFKIIRGIAQGLFYLNEECHLKVIHRDLKASNILLDKDMNPKISDFGLSRLFDNEETQCTNRLVGTFGYMAPEYAMRGLFSIKSDVYSYGVLVLEIVTGRKRNSFHDFEHYKDLLSYTWEHWTKRTALEILDPSVKEEFSENEVLTCIQIGLLCTQEVPAERPLMSSVLLMLSSPSAAVPAPSQPSFTVGTSMLACTPASHNYASISELEPRGYMAPEYVTCGQYSMKSDVYSSGLLLLEIVTGRKRSKFLDSENYSDLLSYTWEHWTKRTALEILDPSVKEEFSENEGEIFWSPYFLLTALTVRCEPVDDGGSHRVVGPTWWGPLKWDPLKSTAHSTRLSAVRKKYGEQKNSQNEVLLTCIQTGLCTQEVPAGRSLMSLVLLMLSSPSAAVPDPSQPRFRAGMDKFSMSSVSEVSSSGSRAVTLEETGIA